MGSARLDRCGCGNYVPTVILKDIIVIGRKIGPEGRGIATGHALDGHWSLELNSVINASSLTCFDLMFVFLKERIHD